MAQMTMALEDDASETVLDVDTQSRLDQTIANVEGYREKRHKASRFLDSNNARSLLWFHQEYEEYLACQKGLDAESNARRIQEMSPHDGETKVTQENLDEALERIMSLTDDAFQTAPWMLASHPKGFHVWKTGEMLLAEMALLKSNISRICVTSEQAVNIIQSFQVTKNFKNSKSIIHPSVRRIHP